ncbi:MAG TPA: hypothetical protein VMW89_05175 [Desulfatiglandales bacterium]|nr:hypothetical protein [Desulfatiglandales bacterium]
MKIKLFALERYFAEYEFSAPSLLSCSDCESFSLRELLELEPDAQTQFQGLRPGLVNAKDRASLCYRLLWL